MSTTVDKQIKAQVRAAVRAEMETAVLKLNQAQDAIRNYCDTMGKRVPGYCNPTYEVRTNK